MRPSNSSKQQDNKTKVFEVSFIKRTYKDTLIPRAPQIFKPKTLTNQMPTHMFKL